MSALRVSNCSASASHREEARNCKGKAGSQREAGVREEEVGCQSKHEGPETRASVEAGRDRERAGSAYRVKVACEVA
jgi:hypothetical protein